MHILPQKFRLSGSVFVELSVGLIHSLLSLSGTCSMCGYELMPLVQGIRESCSNIKGSHEFE